MSQIPKIRAGGPQAIPIVGPFLISPLVAIVSTVELVASGALAIRGQVHKWQGHKEQAASLHKKSIYHMQNGGINLAYSIINTSTIGLSGLLGFGLYRLFTCYMNSVG